MCVRMIIVINMNKERITKIIIFILLLMGLLNFSALPAFLLRINLSKMNLNIRILYEFICDISFMLIIYIIYHKDINRDFKKYFKKFGINFNQSFSYYFPGYLFMIISNIIIVSLVSQAVAGNEENVKTLVSQAPIYMLFSVAIYAPFVEEMIFRKVIYDLVQSFYNGKHQKYVYIVLSGFLFASLHVIGSSSKLIDYIYIIPYLGVGIALAALYYKSKNIFSTIIMHSLHNTILILRYFKGGIK